ncbi:hypothetical protein AB0P12_26080 [Streptomyces subrutilus]|uniref:hypothetical protein n=1 Tax=Streptomyces subrutilus TaxID=36818 RepID=UPI0033C9D7F4
MPDSHDPLRSLFREAAAAGRSGADLPPVSVIARRGERARRRRIAGYGLAACLVLGSAGALVAGLLPGGGGAPLPATSPSAPWPSPSPSTVSTQGPPEPSSSMSRTPPPAETTRPTGSTLPPVPSGTTTNPETSPTPTRHGPG